MDNQLNIWAGYMRHGVFYARHGYTYFGEHAKIMRLAFGLTGNHYVRILR